MFLFYYDLTNKLNNEFKIKKFSLRIKYSHLNIILSSSWIQLCRRLTTIWLHIVYDNCRFSGILRSRYIVWAPRDTLLHRDRPFYFIYEDITMGYIIIALL